VRQFEKSQFAVRCNWLATFLDRESGVGLPRNARSLVAFTLKWIAPRGSFTPDFLGLHNSLRNGCGERHSKLSSFLFHFVQSSNVSFDDLG